MIETLKKVVKRMTKKSTKEVAGLTKKERMAQQKGFAK